MELTPKLKERFTKDMNIPIKLFEEPYFTSRMNLYDTAFDTKRKFDMFLETLSHFETEQDYFAAYNKLKDDVINYLRSQEAMERFMQEDLNSDTFKLKNTNFPKHDIFKRTFDGKFFVSIDMKKANFTALRHYDSSIVGGKNSYEEFIGMFTDFEYFKQSKYIRQVVFGNCNPKRQVAYQKRLMDEFLTCLLTFTVENQIVFFSNDEIVVDVSELSEVERKFYSTAVQMLIDKHAELGVHLRQELFELRHIPGTDGYIKKFLDKEGYEFKCLDALLMPFVLRAYAGEEVKEEDLVFRYENRLAKLLDVPTVEVV